MKCIFQKDVKSELLKFLYTDLFKLNNDAATD